MNKQRLGKKQKELLEALRLNCCNITEACKAAHSCRKTYYNYLENPLFKAEVEKIHADMINLAESKLFTAVNNGNMTAVIFLLKTRGGYRELHGNEISGSVDVSINKKIIKSKQDLKDVE